MNEGFTRRPQKEQMLVTQGVIRVLFFEISRKDFTDTTGERTSNKLRSTFKEIIQANALLKIGLNVYRKSTFYCFNFPLREQKLQCDVWSIWNST